MKDVRHNLGSRKYGSFWTGGRFDKVDSDLDVEHAEGVDGFDLGKVDEVGVEAGNKAADLFSDRHDHLRNKKPSFFKK